MTVKPPLPRQLERFNLHGDPLFQPILEGAIARFQTQSGASAIKQEALDAAVSEIDEQIIASRIAGDAGEVTRLRAISKTLRNKPIVSRMFYDDVWRTTITGLGITYTRGMHRLPRWSRDGTADDGLSFRVMVITAKSHLDPHRRQGMDRIAIDTLDANAAVFSEILALVTA